jgi:hypothetical protein
MQRQMELCQLVGSLIHELGNKQGGWILGQLVLVCENVLEK